MGIEDKITGRIKQAAGDLLGNDGLKRQGAREERKADAEAEARDAQARADAKAAEARDLQLKTDPVELSHSSSHEDLYEEAGRLGIPGRANMSKDELAAEITARK
ncbi:MAG TPA: hypothetical protein VH247_05745 [Thermoleophilaceae bacterium]|jgi:uncharacterized protein YjbJ (UPF0337 family)|nr:hypothetical protein [Thermoleophilaceae bacterium]